MNFNFLDTLSVFMVLFAVIDITGSMPIIIDLKNRYGKIQSLKATLVAFGIMLSFLFLGEKLLELFGVDISSFAIAGAFVLFFLALEMVLGIELFKGNYESGASIVPIAFPLIAGAGSITTLLSLKAQYSTINIIIALTANMVVVFTVLRLTHSIERFLGKTGIEIFRKAFGIILLAISIKLFTTNIAVIVHRYFPGIEFKVGQLGML